MIDGRALAHQLLAIRAQVDALLVQLEPPAEEAGATECPHPVSQRENLTVMGGPTMWRCRLCGHEQVENDS